VKALICSGAGVSQVTWRPEENLPTRVREVFSRYGKVILCCCW
jgi:hypothetical protein